MNRRIDLHMHSMASDGTNTPAELLTILKEKGIQIAALTDHNSTENSIEFRRLAKDYGIAAINGVEIDTILDGETYHMLCLGINPRNNDIKKLASDTLKTMMDNNRELIARMSPDYEYIDLADYDSYVHDRRMGGWKSAHYLIAKGAATTISDVIRLHVKYDCLVENTALPKSGTVIETAHKAGGYAILAHPGEYFDDDVTTTDLLNLYARLYSLGLDGIECRYPTHNDLVTGTSIKFCKDNDMIITGGCDYHGKLLPKREIGKIYIDEDMTNIDKLLNA